MKTIRVAIEVKDEKRPIDIQRVESYLGKYNGNAAVRVDQVIIVARKGFTSTARERARVEGIKLLTIAQAKNENWTTVGIPKTSIINMDSLNLAVHPHLTKIRIVPPLPVDSAVTIHKTGRVLCGGCGRDSGTVVGLIKSVIFDHKDTYHADAFRQLLSRAKSDPTGASLTFHRTYTNPPRIHFQGNEYLMQELHATFIARYGSGKITRTTYEMASSDGDTQVVHHLCADIGPSRFQLLVPNSEKPMRIAMNVSDISPKGRTAKRKMKAKAARIASQRRKGPKK